MDPSPVVRRLALLVLAGLLAACSSAPDPPPLVGVSWEAISVNGQPPRPGHPITLTLEPSGRLFGSTGCNSYGAEAGLREGRLVVGELRMTTAMCADPVAGALERGFVEVLNSQPQVRLADGRLVLRSGAGEVVLQAALAGG